MAITINAASLDLRGAVVKTSGGVWYAIVPGGTKGTYGYPEFRIYKNVDTSPSLQSTVTDNDIVGADEEFTAMDAAIDSTDDIHVVVGLPFATPLYYRVYDTGTDSWLGSWESVGIVVDGLLAFTTYGDIRIWIDSNDKPHVLTTMGLKIKGTTYGHPYYSNRTGASWATQEKVSATDIQEHCNMVDMVLDTADDPHVVYSGSSSYTETTNDKDGYYRKRTSGTWGTEDEGVADQASAGMAIDVSGTTPWIVFADNNDNIYEGADVDTLSDTGYNVVSTNRQYLLDALYVGTDQYIFYIDTSADVHYIYNTGSGWTDGGAIETGTYTRLMVEKPPSSSNEIGYIFTDGSNIYFNTLDLGGDLSVSETDGVTVDEIVTVETKLAGIVETDGVTLGEQVTARLKSFISETEGITLGELVTVRLGNLQINVSDAVNLGEIINVILSNLEISETDGVTVSEFVNIGPIKLEVNVSDNINLGEFVNVTLPDALQINKTDGLTVSEFVNVNIPGEANLTIEVSDGVIVSEIVAVAPIKLEISKTDGVTIAEIVNLEMGALQIAELDGLTVADIAQVGAIKLEISTTDGVNLGEIINVTLPDALQIDVTDGTTLAEFINVILPDALQIAIAEGLTLGEFTNVEIPIRIDVADNVDLGEFVSVSLPDALQIAIAEGVTVGEEINVNLPVEGVIYVNVSDGLTVDEFVSVTMTPLQVDVTDGVEVADIAQVDPLLIEIFETDAVTVADAVNVSIPVEGILYINVEDGVTVADAANLDPLKLEISETDGVTVADEIDLATLLFIQALDGLTVADAASLLLPDALQIGVTDNVTVADAINVLVLSGGDLSINVLDAVILGELVDIDIVTPEEQPRKWVKRKLRYDRLNQLGVPGNRYNKLRGRHKR